MNSLDPWRTIALDFEGNMLCPSAAYGHPFYREVPSWIHYGDDATTTRQLFDGAFVAGWIASLGANMSNNIGAQLTALSPPGYGRYRPYRPYGGYYRPYGGYYRPYGGYYRPYGGYYRPYGGVFFGAEGASVPGPQVEPPQRTGLTADLAPVIAPATGDITLKKTLDDKQILHVEICVDGKCYRTSMNLAPAIEGVMQKLVRWHESQHAQQPPPSTVVSTVEKAIGVAGDGMAEALVDQHVAVMTGGWLSDVGGAIGGTLRKLQPVISTVATGVATVYGGPAAGAAAAKFAPMITNLQANALDPKGNPKKRAQAKKALQRLTLQSKTDPGLAQALQAANRAVKNTTVAYHVKDTAQRAAAGDTAAQYDINNLVKAAEQGDPVAKSTFDVLSQTFANEVMKSEWGAKLWENVTGRGPATISGWHSIIGAAVDDLRARARSQAVKKSGNAAGVIQMADRSFQARGFPSLDDAIDWLQRSTGRREDFLYAAVYEKDREGEAYIQAEEFGGVRASTPRSEPFHRASPATTSGGY